VTIAVDSSTGLPVASSDTGGSNTGGMSDFGTGWDDNTMSHGRPGSVEFAADGRLFLANDLNGDIIWIAPEGL
jgi:glucose/arabinose dehydrogenase